MENAVEKDGGGRLVVDPHRPGKLSTMRNGVTERRGHRGLGVASRVGRFAHLRTDYYYYCIDSLGSRNSIQRPRTHALAAVAGRPVHGGKTVVDCDRNCF
jgi:hypothetical protein